MDTSSIINLIFLCVLNSLFMVVGMVLNLVVIVSLWKLSQLRKKLCYFTIFVLSCFDLAVVTIAHPILILSTIVWSMGIYHEEIRITRIHILILLGGFSIFALLTLNIERFLALNCPFFHQSAVTKRKLIIFLVLLIIIEMALSPLYYYIKGKTSANMLIAIFFILIWLVFIYINYKIFVVAKSKRKDERAASSEISAFSHLERKKRKMNFKNISTCLLAVGCFFVSSTPQLIYCMWGLTSNTSRNEKHAILFNIWSSTFVCINSTLNCVIFFWRNSILRREGMEILQRFISTKKYQLSYS